jgi:ureidoglycolate lyase
LKMNDIKIQELSESVFSSYGSYADMYNPAGPLLGNPPGGFYRDMLVMSLGRSNTAGFSITRALNRDRIIDLLEVHDYTGEGILPLDGNIIIYVGEATPRIMVPLSRISAFMIPKGTFVVLKPGVWHETPFADDCEAVNVLTVLPERTYANDCYRYDIPEDRQIRIVP